MTRPNHGSYMTDQTTSSSVESTLVDTEGFSNLAIHSRWTKTTTENKTFVSGVASTIVIQDLTFTAAETGSDGDNIKISYTGGATAGAEVVTVSGTHISVQIQSGTSTATQIKAAYDLESDATDLAACSVSGTGGTAQVTVKESNLAGGVNAVASTKKIQNITYTAKTAHADGDNITINYTTGQTAGAETVGVVGTVITVGIETGVSTTTQIKAAIDGDTDAAALVSLVIDTGEETTVQAEYTDPIALEGGVTEVASTIALQDLTYTAETAGTGGDDININYTIGATAGSEVVTVSDDTITIQIANGTSTADQIKAAFDAFAGAVSLAACTVTGTGGTAQKTVNEIELAGGVTSTIDQTANTITITGHGYLTGLKFQITTTSALPTGLETSTDYFLIKVDDNTIQVASDRTNALAGTAVAITGDGTGTHTVSTNATLAATAKLFVSLDTTNWNEFATQPTAISATGDYLWQFSNMTFRQIKVVATVTSGEATFNTYISQRG